MRGRAGLAIATLVFGVVGRVKFRRSPTSGATLCVQNLQRAPAWQAEIDTDHVHRRAQYTSRGQSEVECLSTPISGVFKDEVDVHEGPDATWVHSCLAAALWQGQWRTMSAPTTPPQIFSTKIRAAKRRRAQTNAPIAEHFLIAMLAEELADRLEFVSRTFSRVALVGPISGQAGRFDFGDAVVDCFAYSAGEEGQVMAAEGIIESLAVDGDLATAAGRYDLIIAAPIWDAVNDLPGVLTQFRLALKPDGLFLGALFAGGSLPTLRTLMQSADDGRGVARLHPQVDLRSLGDLMQRAGFAMPVVDEEPLTLTYADPMRALGDLRALGQGNALTTQMPLKGKAALIRALTAWVERADADGRVAEHLAIAHLSGWAPSPDQPKPARRGSATVSLAPALKSPPSHKE